MALAKKCDRCGVLYEHYKSLNGISLERYGHKGDFICTEKKFDLCPDCMAALVKFLEGRDQ